MAKLIITELSISNEYGTSLSDITMESDAQSYLIEGDLEEELNNYLDEILFELFDIDKSTETGNYINEYDEEFNLEDIKETFDNDGYKSLEIGDDYVEGSYWNENGIGRSLKYSIRTI